MITLSNNIKGLALLHQVKEIYGKVNTSDSLLETVLYWGINCTNIQLNRLDEAVLLDVSLQLVEVVVKFLQ